MFQKFLIFLILLISLVLVGCSDNQSINFHQSDNFKTLNTVKYPDLNTKKETISSDFVFALRNFTYQTTNQLFTNEENYIYSPISLYMALSMVLEGSSPKAKAEIENLLGLNLNQIPEAMKAVYNNNFYKNKEGTMRLANSIWLKNGFSVQENYLNRLSEDYYAEVYQTDFDFKSHQNIIDWINYYTENFLNLNKEKFPVSQDTILLLLNTIYYQNKWKIPFDEEATRSLAFNSPTGIVQADFMSHELRGLYKQNEDYEVLRDYFENDNSITYLLPREGVDVLSLLSDNTLQEAIYFENNNPQTIIISVPKFKYSSNFSLNESLMKLGVNEIFDPRANPLDLISKDSGLYISSIKQNAGIEISEAGVKAAAVTGVVTTTSIPPTLVLNRPFIYLINDASGIPLFVGVLQNPVN